MYKIDIVYFIRDYIECYLSEPYEKISKEHFIRQSYAKHAAYELIDLILDKPYEDPHDIFKEFIMCKYSLAIIGNDNHGIFEVAIQTATDIWSMLD